MVRAQTFIPVILVLLSCLAFGENNTIVRVGVALLENRSTRGVPLDVERDRLVSAINDLKPDKKTHVKLEAVPLDGSTGNDVTDEAVKKNCDYIVYPVLLDLRQLGDPYMPQPGTIQTNPNAGLGSQSPETQAMNPSFEATVAYKLYNVSAHTTTPGPAFSERHDTTELNTVSQVMNRIALNVLEVIRKGGQSHPMREQD